MNSRRMLHLLLLALSVAVPSRGVVAQQEPVDGLRPVEQIVADRGPLSTSLRWVQYGLNQPSEFNDLYQLPVGLNDYVRRNSGLWAVFPRSIYQPTRQGLLPGIPAGTVYYIGGPADVLPQIAANQEAYLSPDRNPVDRLVDSRIEARLVDTRVPPASILPDLRSVRIPPRTDSGTSAGAPAGTEAPQTEGQAVRQRLWRDGWHGSESNLSFVRDESHRRACLMRAVRSASPGSVRTGPPATDGQAARGSSGPVSK